MTTAVAAAPVLAPAAEHSVAHARTYAAIAPSSASASATPTRAALQESALRSSPPELSRASSDGKRSPTSHRNGRPPKISIKKEPASPELPTSKHRPRKLDLSAMPNGHSPGTARPSGPLTARDSAGLQIQDVGLACLSPGFHTHDPTMREQLQRSIDVREQQRLIIEARQKGTRPPSDGEGSSRHEPSLRNGLKTPNTSRRKGPPPGLTINAPSHQQFSNERVIQSAPLNQSFTGLRQHNLQPMPRQVANQPASLSQSSHIHHVPANQTNNRLPPISDVFGSDTLGGPQTSRPRYLNDSPGHSSHSNNQPPLPSPGFPSAQHGPPTGRPREYKSAEEAVQSMSGGREDLLPRIVHYGGHQPPTPPSPMPKHNRDGQGLGLNAPSVDLHRSGSGRRRGRDEYERDMGTPPLGSQRRAAGPFGEGRDSPDTNRRKKEEFIQLCSRAWDLFHT